jgi:hypothetical protein
LVQTVRHFFPQLNRWLDQLPDSRVQEACTYSRRFLAWWGMALYVLQLGSRRQLDFELRDGGPAVLANLNRLAETEQTTLPSTTRSTTLCSTGRWRAGSVCAGRWFSVCCA